MRKLGLRTFGLVSSISAGLGRKSISPISRRKQVEAEVGVVKQFYSTMRDNEYYTIGLTGSSGCIGTAFRDELSRKGSINGKPVRLVRLVRSVQADAALPLLGLAQEQGKTELFLKWNPNGKTSEEILDPEAVARLHAIVHLSGENVGTGLGLLGFLPFRPWSAAKKKEILDSRVVTTKALSTVVATSSSPKTYIVGGGIGIYGGHFVGDEFEAVDESADTTTGQGFLADVARQWEAATSTAVAAGVKMGHRVVNLRNGVVLSKFGGALQNLYPIFWLGGGGRIGSGQQYFSFISARDQARAMVHVLETPSLSGPVNICSPEPCTNSDFTNAFGECLQRPTLLPFPSFAVNLLFGEMGQDMLLSGVRAKPTKLLKSGFVFRHPTINEAISSALDETI